MVGVRVRELAEALEGAVILAIEKPNLDRHSEAQFKLRYRKSGEERGLHFCATDLGFWTEGHTITRRGRTIHSRVSDLLFDLEHAANTTPGAEYLELYVEERFESASQLLAFRCDELAWKGVVPMSALKEAKLRGLDFTTPEARDRLLQNALCGYEFEVIR